MHFLLPGGKRLFNKVQIYFNKVHGHLHLTYPPSLFGVFIWHNSPSLLSIFGGKFLLPVLNIIDNPYLLW